MTGAFPMSYGQPQVPVRYRPRPHPHPHDPRYRRGQSAHPSSSVRHSADFDMLLSSDHGGGGGRPINNVFRRAKSIEWDRDVVANNIEDMGRQSRTLLNNNFHRAGSQSNMLTLDKRISASSDQLDRVREIIRDTGPTTGANKHHSRHKTSVDSYFSSKAREKEKPVSGRKTPFEIFLEDDGPYSRKLFGPVDSDTSTQQAKVMPRDIAASSKSTEFLDKSGKEFVEQRDIRSISAIKKGLLWQQRDKLFSRWKERFFILTNDYFHCFKKGSFKVTEMGEFIFKVKLSSISSINLLDKRGFLTICLNLGSISEGRIYLRRAEGLREWYSVMKLSIDLKRSRQPYPYFPQTKNREDGGEGRGALTDSDQTTGLPKGINRLSLVTDLLMSEAVRHYTRGDTRPGEPREHRNFRKRKEHTSEDSGVESGHGLENNGGDVDSATDSVSEHSAKENDNNISAPKEPLQICHL